MKHWLWNTKMLVMRHSIFFFNYETLSSVGVTNFSGFHKIFDNISRGDK